MKLDQITLVLMLVIQSASVQTSWKLTTSLNPVKLRCKNLAKHARLVLNLLQNGDKTSTRANSVSI